MKFFIIGVYSHCMEHYNGEHKLTFQMVIDMMMEDKLITDGFITHKFKLDDYKKAFKLLIENPSNTVKVVLECNK